MSLRCLLLGHGWHARGGVLYVGNPGLSYANYRCCRCGLERRRRGQVNDTGGISLTAPAKRLLP